MNRKYRNTVALMLPAYRDGAGSNATDRDGDDINYHTFQEPLFRPFAADQYAPNWRGGQSRRDNFPLVDEDDLLSGPPGFTSYGGTQNLVSMNIPHNAEHVCVDEAINEARSHPQCNEDSRGKQQVDSTHGSPSHLDSLENGSWRAPERVFNSRFWSMSEQVSLINAAEKCILEDKCWDSENRWEIVYAHMCNEGHVNRPGNKLISKFLTLMNNYQRVRAWNSDKERIAYDDLPVSQRKTNDLPTAFDSYLYKRMTSFFQKTKFDELQMEETKGTRVRGAKGRFSIKSRASTKGRFSVKTRASTRLKNARNAIESTMQEQHGNDAEDVDGILNRDVGEGHNVNVDSNNGGCVNGVDNHVEKVYGQNDEQEAGDKDSFDEIANDNEDVQYHVQRKQTRGRVYTLNGYASKETRPSKKQRGIPAAARAKESKGTKHQAGYGAGEDPVEPSQAYNSKDQFGRPTALTQECNVNKEALVDQIKSCESSIGEMIPIMSTMSQACTQFSQAFSQTVMMKAALVRRFLGSEGSPRKG
ncbi:hypothetical protein GOP47_0028789 [Adiantum capillus-veneris]|nr:hypothetical protein GOP47_0028789 [Adiantum capillus-veneris]